MSSATDPEVQISWSTDGGYLFGQPINRRIGGDGDTRCVYINRIGLTNCKGIVFKLRVSDPVHVAFLGGQAAVEAVGA